MLSILGPFRHLLDMVSRRGLGLLLATAAIAPACPAMAASPTRAVRLFRIARSKNKNVVWYVARSAGSALDPQNPVDAYWSMLAEDGRREGLSWAERQLAYGFALSDLTERGCWLRLVAFKERALRVERYQGDFRAITRIAGQPCVLERIFVQATEGGLLPSVEYVELFGHSASGAQLSERVTAR